MKHIDVKPAGEVLVIRPRRNLMGGDECAELRQAADAALEQGNRCLAIDLGAVEHMNSSGIGELVGIFVSYKNRGGRAVLAQLHKKVKDLLILLHLVRVFDVYETVEEATASFAQTG